MQTFVIFLASMMVLHIVFNLAFLCSNKDEYVVTYTRKSAVIKVILGSLYFYAYYNIYHAIQ